MDDIAYERRRFKSGYNARGSRTPEKLLDEGWHKSRTGAATHERVISFRGHDWMAGAACLEADPEIFHPRGRPRLEALAICESCPVMVECGEYAEATGSLGLWGGKVRRRHGCAES